MTLSEKLLLIARQLDDILTQHTQERMLEGLDIEDDTTIRRTYINPTRGQIWAWTDVLKEAAKELKD